jgi:hypothetical protein
MVPLIVRRNLWSARPDQIARTVNVFQAGDRNIPLTRSLRSLFSSLPDLIRQSMAPCRCMDHRVKPGGDEVGSRPATMITN